MQITFNGKDIDIEKGTCIADILQENEFGLKFVLVELDGETVDHHEYHETLVEEEGSEIEAAYLCGGGSTEFI